MFAFLFGLVLGGAIGYCLADFIDKKPDNDYDDYDDWRRL